jgi:WD40 repeat protein
MLTFEAYEELGGVEGALAKCAADTLANLPADVKKAFGPVMQRLVSVASEREGELAARKTVRRDDLPKDDATQKFVEAFVDARLFVADADSDGKATISLAHEALLIRWKDLATWIDEHRAFLTRQDRIAKAADRWHDQKPEDRDGFLLPEGRQLADGIELLEENCDSLREVEIDFIRQSVARQEHLAAAAREQARVAKEQARQAREALAMSDYLQAVEKCSATPPAPQKIIIAHLVRALRMVPTHPLAGPFLASILTRNRQPKQIKLARCLEENERAGSLASAGFSPNREVLASFRPNGDLELWRQNGERIARVDLGADPNRSVSFQFSHSGRLLALTLWDTVRIFQAESGLEVGAPLVHQGEVTSVALSPGGHRLATGEQALQNQLTIWDVTTGQPRWRALHPDVIQTMTCAPDGSWLASGCEDGVVRLWDMEAGKELHAGLVHDDPILRVLASPTGTMIASVTGKKEVHLWNAMAARPCFPPLRISSAVDFLAFSPEGHRLLIGCRDGTHLLWSTRSGRVVHRFSCAGNAIKVICPDFSRLAVASREGEVTIWDIAKGERQTGPFKLAGEPIAMAFGLDGKSLATVDRHGHHAEWDVGPGEMLPSQLVHGGKVSSAEFSPDGAGVLTACVDGVWLWDARQDKLLNRGLGAAAMKQALFGPEGASAAAIGAQNLGYFWKEFPAETAPRELVHDGPINSLAFSRDGQRIVTASDDRSARIWSTKTGLPVLSLAHDSAVLRAGFSADGSRVATASWTFAFVWNVATGEKIAGPFRHTGKVLDAIVDPSGEILLTFSHPGLVQLWDIASTKCLVERRLIDKVTSVSFSPDGESVLTTSEDGMVRLWDSRSGVDLINPLDCQTPATCAAFDSSGQWFAVGGQDGSVQVRNKATGLPVCVGFRHSSPVRQVRFSAGAEQLLVLTHGSVHLWSLPPIEREIPEDLLRVAERLAAVKFDEQTKLLRPLKPEEMESADRAIPVSGTGRWSDYLAWLERGASERSPHPSSVVSREEHVRNLAKTFALVVASPHAAADRELLAELSRDIPQAGQLAGALGMAGMLAKLRQLEVRVLVALKDRASLERAVGLDPKNSVALRLLADVARDPRQAATLRERAAQIDSSKSRVDEAEG